MYELLTSVVESLNNTITTHSGSTFLLKIIVLLVIFNECKILAKFSSHEANRLTISILLKNLVDKESSFRIISTDFFVHYQNSILEVLDTLITSAVEFKPPIAEWIYAVPLLHFVMKKCKPFEQLQGTTWDCDYMTK